MQVFKTYFQILNRLKGLAIMYIAIFIGIVSLIAFFTSKDSQTGTYESASLNVAVINNDNSEIGNAIQDYLGECNTLVTLDDDENSIKDALYWRNAEYIVIIPKGFQQDLEAGKSVEITTKKMEGTYNSAYIDQEISQFMEIIKNYLSAGYTVSEAVTNAKENLEKKVTVQMIQEKDSDSEIKSNSGYFFQFVPYALLSICITIISMIMLAFQKEDVKKRCVCSAMPLREQNMQLTLASLCFSMGIIIVCVIGGIILSKGELLQHVNIWFYVLNCFVFMLVSIAIAFVCGILLKSDDAVNGANNVISLGFCFLGGVYVPLEIMPEGVVNVARFVPTYWYIKANDAVSYMASINNDFLQEYFQYLGVELCFAVAIFAIGLVCSKRKVVFG